MAETTMEVALRTESLSKRYREVLALSKVNLTVREGQIYGFLGPNGAGKTTAIRLILDLISPTKGQVYVFGHRVTGNISPVLPRIGSVLGNPGFYPHLSGTKNLELIHDLLPASRQVSVREGLDLVNLQSKAGLKFGDFSAGMKRRLALAAAYIKDPDLYVLDEPTNGLDPQGRVKVRETIETLGETGKTIFLSTHLMNEVQQSCSQVGVLKAGKLIAEKSVTQLTDRSSGVVVTAGSEQMEQIQKVLGSLEWIRGIQIADEKAHIDCPSERSPEILRILTQEGIELQEIEKKRRSLEDVFLELTEEDQQGG